MGPGIGSWRCGSEPIQGGEQNDTPVKLSSDLPSWVHTIAASLSLTNIYPTGHRRTDGPAEGWGLGGPWQREPEL